MSTKKPKVPKPPKIARKMQEGQVLHFSFGPEGGRQYWLEPSNKNVTEPAALKAISWPEVTPLDDALLPDTTPQSWAWKAA